MLTPSLAFSLEHQNRSQASKPSVGSFWNKACMQGLLWASEGQWRSYSIEIECECFQMKIPDSQMTLKLFIGMRGGRGTPNCSQRTLWLSWSRQLLSQQSEMLHPEENPRQVSAGGKIESTIFPFFPPLFLLSKQTKFVVPSSFHQEGLLLPIHLFLQQASIS